MAYTIAWAESALSDLEQIVRYIAADNPDVARQFGLTLVSRVEEIATFPRRGRVVPEKNEETLREIILTPYRVVYELNDTQQRLYVLRVWHAARGPITLG